MVDKKLSTESKESSSSIIESKKIEELSKDELIHDLKTHQIELELQNEALRESEKEILALRDKNSDIYDFAPVGYLMLNNKGTILKSNLKFSEMVEKPRSSIINFPLSNHIIDSHQDAYEQFLNSIQKTQLAQTTELCIQSHANNILWVRFYSTCVEDTDGSNYKIQLFITDIAELKNHQRELDKSETKLSNHLQNTPLGCISWDTNFDCTEWNKSAEAMFGYTAEEAIGRNACELIVPTEIKDVVNDVYKSLLEQKGGTRSTNENITKDGHIIKCDWYNTPIIDEYNTVMGVSSLVQDITERLRIEEALRQSEKQLHQSQKMEAIGQITGGVAHDFNNILGIITGYVGLAKKQSIITGDIKQTKYLNSVADATFRAANLVSKMLSFTRKNENTAKPVYLQSLLKDEQMVLFSGLPSSIEINVTIDEALPTVLFGITEFDQLLINLVTNAQDAMDEVGIIDIRLGWSAIDSATCTSCQKQIANKWIELSVTDSGKGVESDLLSSIFHPFYSSKEVGKGTGLGLSVIHGIMHSHGAHIIVESKVGIGTTFRLLFPPHNKEYTEVLTTEDKITPQVSIKPYDILVVDDETSLIKLTGQYLESYGYKATMVSSSIKALELFKQQPDKFSLVITDQTMPELTGKELVLEVRKIRPNLPVIINSGFSQYMDAEKAEKLNVNFLQKPVDLDEVICLVNELLGDT